MKSLSVKLGVILFIIGIALFYCAEVWGEDWKPYFATELELVFFDASSITHPSENIVRVLVRSDYTEKGVLNWVRDFGKKYENLSHSIILSEINCIEKKLRRLSWVDYDHKGSVIDSTSPPSEWRFIIPESSREILYNEVCK